MEQREYDLLLERANTHVITRPEFEAAAMELASPNRKGKASTLMAILRKDRTRTYEAVMIPFLEGPDYRDALNALTYICLEYGQTARYTEYLLRFIEGVPYDWNDSIKSSAIGIVGIYLNETCDSELLRELIIVAERGTNKRIRVEAHKALFEALGHNGLPYGKRDPNAERARDYEALGLEIVEEAKQRLVNEEADPHRSDL